MGRTRQAQNATAAPPPPSSPSSNGVQGYDTGGMEAEDERELTSDEEAEQLFAQLREEGGAQPKATVNRVDPTTGKRTWLSEISSELATPEYIATRWGGGKYYVKHKVQKPTGGWRYAFHQTIEIDPSVQPQAPAAPASSAPVFAVPGAPTDLTKLTTADLMNAGIVGLFQQMQNLNALTLSAAERIAKSSEQPRQSIAETLVPFVPVFVEMVKGNRASSDPTELAVKLAQLMKRDGTSLTEVMGVVKTVLELSGKGPPGESDTTMGVVREGINTLGKAVEAFAESRRPLVGHPVAVVDASPSPSSAHAPVPPPPTAPPAPVNGDRPWVAEARPHLPLLLANSSFVPPEAAALMIEKNMTDQAWDDLITDLKTDGFEARLIAAFPAASAVGADWFGQVKATLLDWVAQAEKEQAAHQPPPATGG